MLDAGAGTGAASLCLAARVPECRIVGLELQRPLQRIASHNVTQNALEARIEMVEGRLERPPPRLAAASFDHVMTNPPHLAASAASLSPDHQRALAHAESSLDLGGWLAGCLRMLRHDGRLTLIHRADRLSEVLAALLGRAGEGSWFRSGRPRVGRPSGCSSRPARAREAAAPRAWPGLA